VRSGKTGPAHGDEQLALDASEESVSNLGPILGSMMMSQSWLAWGPWSETRA